MQSKRPSRWSVRQRKQALDAEHLIVACSGAASREPRAASREPRAANAAVGACRVSRVGRGSELVVESLRLVHAGATFEPPASSSNWHRAGGSAIALW
jgi:hypothetical protein